MKITVTAIGQSNKVVLADEYGNTRTVSDVDILEEMLNIKNETSEPVTFIFTGERLRPATVTVT